VPWALAGLQQQQQQQQHRGPARGCRSTPLANAAAHTTGHCPCLHTLLNTGHQGRRQECCARGVGGARQDQRVHGEGERRALCGAGADSHQGSSGWDLGVTAGGPGSCCMSHIGHTTLGATPWAVCLTAPSGVAGVPC
jgi:hypothetical protein